MSKPYRIIVKLQNSNPPISTTIVQIVLQEGNGDGSGKGELLALTGLGAQMELWDGDYGRCQLRCNELQPGLGSGVA